MDHVIWIVSLEIKFLAMVTNNLVKYDSAAPRVRQYNIIDILLGMNYATVLSSL